MPIVSGKVSYSKTIQVRQYEPRNVTVEIAFEVGNQENIEDLIEDASDICKVNCLHLLKQSERDE